jgi:DNA-directed RNA polymerase alpha subunit
MSDDKKPTSSMSLAERKVLRVLEARQAMADHERDRNAFQDNHERLRAQRQAREATEGPMMVPAPEIPDDTLIERLTLPARVQNALSEEGIKTVGEVREKSDLQLLAFQNLGKGSVIHLRKTLGLPSLDGMRPIAGKRS